MNKKIVYLDMDGVLADFQGYVDSLSEEMLINYQGKYDTLSDIYRDVKPIDGAIEAFHKLSEKYDTYILSTSPWNNPLGWSQKLEWVKTYLGEKAHKRLTLTHHKELAIGDYLIDDRENNGAKDFKGELILFGSPKFPRWESVLEYLL